MTRRRAQKGKGRRSAPTTVLVPLVFRGHNWAPVHGTRFGYPQGQRFVPGIHGTVSFKIQLVTEQSPRYPGPPNFFS